MFTRKLGESPENFIRGSTCYKECSRAVVDDPFFKFFFHAQVERSQESERPDSMVSETSSIRDSVGSFKEWEDYNTALQDVLNWLSKAERTLESQENISGEVDAVKKQFHGHEVNTTS